MKNIRLIPIGTVRLHSGPSLQTGLFALLTIATGSLLPARTSAQTLGVLHSFSPRVTDGRGISTNSDGASPYAGLTYPGNGNSRYGTVSLGGSAGNGAVFAITDTADGITFTNLHHFSFAATNAFGDFTNSDGIGPWAGLVVSGNTLYGTAYRGGTNGEGTLFALYTDGTGFRTLHTFSATGPTEVNADGAYPNGQLLLDGTKLYGTAYKGGTSGFGTIFAVNTDGTGFIVLHSFTNGSDGAVPVAGLILSGRTLYGTASGGGAGGSGTVFAINVDGTGFTILHAFDQTRSIDGSCVNDSDCARTFPGFVCVSGVCKCTGFCGRLRGGEPPVDWGEAINLDGANPNAALVFSGGDTLYGTAATGGPVGFGTVFSMNTNGTDYRVLHAFTGGSDGANPWSALALAENHLYGTAYAGGSAGHGVVFALDTSGDPFITLHAFSGGTDGGNPIGGLVLSGNALSGTAELGGASGSGTIFYIGFAPTLTVTPSGTNLLVTWPAAEQGYSTFELQMTASLTAPAVWTSFPLESVFTINGLNTVTNRIFGAHQFYTLRLRCAPGPPPDLLGVYTVNESNCQWEYIGGGPGGG